MKLTMFDAFVIEGEPTELAFFMSMVLCVLKDKDESDKKKEVESWMAKYGDKTFDELMRMERDGEE